jgi:hypothetical protein
MGYLHRPVRKVLRVVAAGAAAAFACGMVLAVDVRPAVAESPPNCSQNFLNVGIGVPPTDPQSVFNGAAVTYTVQLTNEGPGACDAENVNTTFCCPGPDGQPAPTSDALGLVPVTECAGSPPFEDCCVTLPEAASVPANGAAVDLPNVVCRDFFNPVPALPAQLFVRANSAGILRAGADPGVPNGAIASKLFPITIVPCDVQLDKQCSVDGGTTWHDVGYPDDGIGDVCDTDFGSDVLVRYLVKNPNVGPDLTVFSCGVTDSNGVILTGTLDAGDLLSGQEITLDPLQRVCDGTLTAEEPNTGTVECFCTQDLDGRFTTTDTDQDNITCAAMPNVHIEKTCSAENNCVNTASVTVTNTGEVNLTNCQVTDRVYESSGGACTGTATRTITPPSFDLAVGANNVVNIPLDHLPVGDTCDTAEVTCDAASGGQVSDGPADAICAPMCDDGNLCTQEMCDPELGCVQTDAVQCDTSDRCHPEVCNPETGLCEPGNDDTAVPFLAKVRLQFNNFAEIDGGIGVNDVGGRLRLGRRVFVTDGSGTFGDIIRIGNDSSVYAIFGNQVVTGRGVVVRGPRGVPELPLTDPFCPVPEFMCGTSAVRVDGGSVMGPLAPGSYGTVRILNGGTLRLAPGTFDFCELRTGRRTSILTTGPTTINVVGKVRLANGSVFGPVSGAPTPILNVLGSQVRIGAGSELQAYISAPGALLTVGRLGHLVGSFCVYRTRSDKGVIIECPPDDVPASPSGAFVN